MKVFASGEKKAFRLLRAESLLLSFSSTFF